MNQYTFDESNSRLGSELSATDRSQVLARFVHRMTTESKRQFPEFSRRMISGGYHMPERDDAQWLAETRFATDSAGRLNSRVSNCQATHESEMRRLEIAREPERKEAAERAHWAARDVVTV